MDGAERDAIRVLVGEDRLDPLADLQRSIAVHAEDFERVAAILDGEHLGFAVRFGQLLHLLGTVLGQRL